MAGELTDEKLGAMVLAGIGAFPHGSVTPFSAKDIGACALMVGDLRNEVARLRGLLHEADTALIRWSGPPLGEPDNGRRPLSVRDLHERIRREMVSDG